MLETREHKYVKHTSKTHLTLSLFIGSPALRPQPWAPVQASSSPAPSPLPPVSYLLQDTGKEVFTSVP